MLETAIIGGGLCGLSLTKTCIGEAETLRCSRRATGLVDVFSPSLARGQA